MQNNDLIDLFGDNLPKVLALYRMTESELIAAMLEKKPLIQAALQTLPLPRCIQ